MRKNLNKALSTAVLTGGMFVAGSGMAHADLITVQDEVRVGDVLSVPVNVCGNSVALLGKSDSTCAPDKAARAKAATDPLISVPVNVCGNSVSLLGDGSASCGEPPAEPNGSLISAPVTVCGNSVAVGGSASGDCGSQSEPEPEPEEPEVPGGPNPKPPNHERPPGSGIDHIGDQLGHERPSLIGSAAAAEVKPLAKTGFDALQFLAAGLALCAAGAATRVLGGRRRETS